MNKFALACICAALLLPSVRVQQAHAAPLVLKAAHGAPESNVQHLGWVKFKELIEAKSNGTMVVEIYGNNQLGGDREICEATQLGNITMVSNATAAASAFNKEFYVFDAPFLFKNREEAYAALDGPLGKAVLASEEKFGLKGLGFWENGFRQLTNSKNPVSTPADLSGLKLRTMESTLHVAAWKLLGANPTPMAFGELFTALQQKTVDGQDTAIDLFHAAKFYEVQNYVTKSNHNYGALIVHMNLEFWNNLSPDQKNIVEDSMHEATQWQRNKAVETTEAAEKFVRNYGLKFVELTPEQLQLFRDKTRPVHQMIKARVSPAIFALFEKLL